jgi:hypothetical protein
MLHVRIVKHVFQWIGQTNTIFYPPLPPHAPRTPRLRPPRRSGSLAHCPPRRAARRRAA